MSWYYVNQFPVTASCLKFRSSCGLHRKISATGIMQVLRRLLMYHSEGTCHSTLGTTLTLIYYRCWSSMSFISYRRCFKSWKRFWSFRKNVTRIEKDCRVRWTRKDYKTRSKERSWKKKNEVTRLGVMLLGVYCAINDRWV